jgi:hypothetical protein
MLLGRERADRQSGGQHEPARDGDARSQEIAARRPVNHRTAVFRHVFLLDVGIYIAARYFV